MGAFCRCACHSTKLGDLHDAMHRGDGPAVAYYAADDHLEIPPKTDLHSQLESWLASGCPCLTHHVRLIPPKPKYLPPKLWDPSQADGSDLE